MGELMWGLDTIKAMNAEAGEVAREAGKEPLRFNEYIDSLDDVADLGGFPNMGTACEDIDERHERLDTLFCDSTGFGGGALSKYSLWAKLVELREEHGDLLVAVESVGQFQMYLAVWKA